MNKTIYLRDDEGPIWERARELAGEKLSPVIVAALKRYIAETEAQSQGFDRIIVEYDDDHNLPRKKAFFGKWIFPPGAPCIPTAEADKTRHFAVAVTAKGAVVIYSWFASMGRTSNEGFEIFDSFADVCSVPRYVAVARAAVEKRGVPVEELDI